MSLDDIAAMALIVLNVIGIILLAIILSSSNSK